MTQVLWAPWEQLNLQQQVYEKKRYTDKDDAAKTGEEGQAC
jgi:hypothetical protein